MPMYEYLCEACGKPFDKLVRTADRDAAIACPECGSEKTARKLSAITVGASEGAKTTSLPIGGGCACGGPGPCGMR